MPNNRKKIIILTGAGMSAESGLSTFRDSDGLWEQHKVEDICTPEALANNRELVIDFYNERRRQLVKAAPNQGHLDLVQLEEKYEVHIITQNVDDLHEKAGSTNVLHLHGELMKTRSMGGEHRTYTLNEDNYITKVDDRCEEGYLIRPHIVFFGEAVPMIEIAAELCSEADIMVIIGTSLNVYPAAGLMSYAPKQCPIYFIDPNPNVPNKRTNNLHIIQKRATEGVQQLLEMLR